MEPVSEPVIGIDLGTSYCCVAVFQDGKVEVVPNETGSRVTPSFVAFTEQECLVGEAAKRYGQKNPEQCIYEVKRLMGRAFRDTDVQQDSKHWPFTVVEGSSGEALVEVPRLTSSYQQHGQHFKPEEISAMLLRRMKKIAEDFTNYPSIRNAVITVPAYFNDSQRQATKDAGENAGLNVLRLMNEPTAAALAYGHQRLIGKKCQNKRILLFDLGGGTFDVSIIAVTSGVDIISKFTVNGVAGDRHLGGADFDNRLVCHLLDEFEKQTGTNVALRSNQKTLLKLKGVAESAKRGLSSSVSADIDVERVYEDKDLHTELGRAKFESLIADLLAKCMAVVQDALNIANVSRTDIAEVVLVGGSTRIPRVKEMLKEFFGRPPLACGHVDEAVAYGAAVMAGMRANRCDDPGNGPRISVEDVTALSIGVKLNLDQMNVIIRRSSPLPAQGSECFSTAVDYQTSLSFYLYEGERAMCSDNRFLGVFHLQGFTPVRATGKPVTRLILNVDENGILHAAAEATDNHIQMGLTEGITIDCGHGQLNKEKAPMIVQEAQASKNMDDAIREAFRERRKLRALAIEMRKDLPKITPPNKRRLVTKRVNEVLTWLGAEERVATSDIYTGHHIMLLTVKDAEGIPGCFCM
ncbi:hypothetical protein CBR_g52099 [Chara braunii]|uniref:Uncharacterized protein n=1 Tax=Chara braunii TaxID=69332 RepID=A0A388M9G1_CHABU|nr:hypothetical protein CBR_g52099 [Chara braunii]|eukprot:GBG91217.1 hypothetical protein CBR_g52099 [Chara braunii]